MADNDHRKPIAPYVEWAVATEFAYLPGEWFRVLLELTGPAADFAEMVERDSRLVKLIKVPSIYQSISREFAREDVTFCMAIMSKSALEAVVGHPHREEIRNTLATVTSSLKRIELGTPTSNPFDPSPATLVTESLATTPPQSSTMDWPSPTNDSVSPTAPHGSSIFGTRTICRQTFSCRGTSSCRASASATK